MHLAKLVVAANWDWVVVGDEVVVEGESSISKGSQEEDGGVLEGLLEESSFE